MAERIDLNQTRASNHESRLIASGGHPNPIVCSGSRSNAPVSRKCQWRFRPLRSAKRQDPTYADELAVCDRISTFAAQHIVGCLALFFGAVQGYVCDWGSMRKSLGQLNVERMTDAVALDADTPHFSV